MIKISGIRYDIKSREEDLEEYVKTKYGILDIQSFSIAKKSVDARKKDDVHYVYSVVISCKNEKQLIKKHKSISEFVKREYVFPKMPKMNKPVIIAGFGPAGMLCALTLAQNGHRVIVIERGKCVEERKKDVENFSNNGIIDENSNVQFGEGGAGTFSDGKLNTGINDTRIDKVFWEFYTHGAPKEILYYSKPHIGTDNLFNMVRNIREDIIKLGGEIRFLTTLTDIEVVDNKLKAVIVNGNERIEADALVLATGHSARDTFRMLKRHSINMEKKTFSIGARIEHKQEMINKSMYGDAWEYIENASYKLNTKSSQGRGVYTFCMCPGGEVIASASSKNTVVTNGMSNFARDGENANAAVLVNVYPEDFDDNDVLSGMYFQEEIEKRGFVMGGKDYSAVCETVGHLYGGENKTDITPTYKPSIKWGSISDVLPDYAVSAIKEALPVFNKKLKGFMDKNAVLTVPETRSSSPVRILRDESCQSSISGIYPCGEGAGYAGGITSAAVDGIRIAEAVVKENGKKMDFSEQ